MSTNNNSESKNDEVDFEPLIMGILSIFSSIGLFFRILYNVVVNQLVRVLVFIAIGFGIGISVYIFSPKNYKTSITLGSRLITNSNSALMINKLENLVEDRSFNNVAELMGLSAEKARSINRLKYKNADNNSEEDTIVENKPFTIEIEVGSSITASELESGIVSFLDNQPYVISQLENRRKFLVKQLKNLNTQINNLDSLKKLVANSVVNRSAGSGFIYGEPIDPVEVNQQREDMYNYLLSLETERDNFFAYKVVSGITISEKAAFPRFRHVAFFVVLGFLFSLITGFSSSRRSLRS